MMRRHERVILSVLALAITVILMTPHVVRAGDVPGDSSAASPPAALPSKSNSSAPSSAGEFAERTLVDVDGSHRYSVYFPPGYDRNKKWPIILFLHGAGERGTDGAIPTYYGIGPILRHTPSLYPAVVVFPQCETWDAPIFSSWSPSSSAGRRALRILDEVVQNESIDPARQSLTGWSMGGFGATALAADSPQRWQAVLAIAGGFDGAPPASLSTAPLWLIHGTNDSIVPIDRSRQLSQSLQNPWPHFRLDEVADSGHEVWEQAYSHEEVASFLLGGGPPAAIDWTKPVPEERMPTAADGAPFIPAATMSQAISLRIGNDALAMISAGIPESIKAERLHGELSPIEQTFTIDGETYELSLQNLTYTARLDSVQLTALPTAEIRADLGVGLELSIGGASLKTRGFSASTSPFRVVIGHRRPVPLNLLVEPRVDNQKVTLQHRETRFPIPDDNWYVEMPSDIELTGTKFTRHEIETGIVGGLYTRKAEVEEQVRSVIPPLLSRLETRLNLGEPIETAGWLWPFPVYPPRLRWVPEQLTVDIHGMTLQLGAVVGASQSVPLHRPLPSRSGTAHLPPASAHSRALHITLDPALMDVVSEEFATAGVARINVRDLDEVRFHAFANPDRMRKILPSLPADVELQTVLALSSPFQIRGVAGTGGENQRVRFSIPRAQLEVFSRNRPQENWTACGLFTIALDQEIQVRFTRTEGGPPLLGLDWLDAAACHVTAEQPVDATALSELEQDVRAAWAGWAGKQSLSTTPAKDFVIGDSRLRIDTIGLGTSAIDIDLENPVTQLSVTGNSALRYRIRGRNTYWSLPRDLDPGQSHRFEVTDPVEIQLFDPRGAIYTIKPGEVATWDESTGVSYGSAQRDTENAIPAVGSR